MVICDRPVIEVCPVEWGRMKDRSVLQWDKDDCAAAGLVKFDLLGLGMLSMLHYAVDLIAASDAVTIDLAGFNSAEVIAHLQPDVLVKGADWPADQIVGRDTVEARGGRVVRIEVTQGYSTTAIIERIRNLRS